MRTYSTQLRKAILAGICSFLPLVGIADEPTIKDADSTGNPAGYVYPGGVTDTTRELNPESSGFTTMELAEISLEQLPECLEYKIVGISLRLIIIPPFIYYYFWTPHVHHYSPDMVSMGHVELDDIPWIELNAILGSTYKQFTNIMFAKILSKLFGMEHREIGGGRYQYKNWGDHQSVNFAENTVVGNPIAMFLEMFSYDMTTAMQNQTGMNNSTYGHGTGVGTNNTYGSGGGFGGASPQYSGGNGNNNPRPQVSQEQTGSFLSSWVTNAQGSQWPSSFKDSMGYQQTMTMMANSPMVQLVKQIMQQIDAALSSVNGKVGDSPFCPVNPTPMEPYYLSGGDAYLWRLGYPAADYEHTTTILNPFSSDVIRPSVSQEGALIEIPEELAAILTPRWGHIYPREGALDDPNSARVATVLARRTQTLLGEKEQPAGRIYRIPKYRVKSAAFARVYPDQTACRRNIANTTDENKLESKGRYAWNVWTGHNCDLYRKGIHIVTIPIGPIYVTPAIPE